MCVRAVAARGFATRHDGADGAVRAPHHPLVRPAEIDPILDRFDDSVSAAQGAGKVRRRRNPPRGTAHREFAVRMR